MDYASQLGLHTYWAGEWCPSPEMTRPTQVRVDAINATMADRDDVPEFMDAWEKHKHIITDWMLASPLIASAFKYLIEEGLDYDAISQRVYDAKETNTWYKFKHLEAMRVQLIEVLCRAPVETMVCILVNKLK